MYELWTMFDALVGAFAFWYLVGLIVWPFIVSLWQVPTHPWDFFMNTVLWPFAATMFAGVMIGSLFGIYND